MSILQLGNSTICRLFYMSTVQCTMYITICQFHSWAQRKLSPLSPLNILLSINVRYFLSDLMDLTINVCNFQKFNDQRLQWFKKFSDTRTLPSPPNPYPTRDLNFILQQCCGAGAVNLSSRSRSQSGAKTGLQNKWIHLER